MKNDHPAADNSQSFEEGPTQPQDIKQSENIPKNQSENENLKNRTEETSKPQSVEKETTIGVHSEETRMKGKYVAGIQHIYESKESENSFEVTCPYCNAKPDENRSGNIECKDCGKVYFVASTFSPRISSYPNLNSEQNEEYKKLIAHISNFIILLQFDFANLFCDHAIELSPATPQAWEYKAFCQYFLEVDKTWLLKTHAESIYRYLLVAKSHYTSEDDVETVGSYYPMAEKIAYRIYNLIMGRIASARKLEDDEKRERISKLIYDLRICHRIYPQNALFLRALADMYSGYDMESWIDVEFHSEEENDYSFIDHSHLDGGLFNYLERIEEIIKEVAPDYNLRKYRGGAFGVEPIPISEIIQKKRIEWANEHAEEIRKREKERMREKNVKLFSDPE